MITVFVNICICICIWIFEKWEAQRRTNLVSSKSKTGLSASRHQRPFCTLLTSATKKRKLSLILTLIYYHQWSASLSREIYLVLRQKETTGKNKRPTYSTGKVDLKQGNITKIWLSQSFRFLCQPICDVVWMLGAMDKTGKGLWFEYKSRYMAPCQIKPSVSQTSSAYLLLLSISFSLLMLEAATCVQSFVYQRDVLGIELHTEMVLPILNNEKNGSHPIIPPAEIFSFSC